MDVAFILSGEDTRLAVSEVLALLGKAEGLKTYLQESNILIAKMQDSANVLPDLHNLSMRLAYTNKISRVIFACKKNELLSRMEQFEWRLACDGSFCVRVYTKEIDVPEKKLAGFIWRALDKPNVNLKKPQYMFEFYSFGDDVICTMLLYEIEHGFNARKAHRRPCLHPTSMHPKLARALVNLTGIKEGVLVDPFCGSGGILIEAGLMGFFARGYDIDEDVLGKAKKNIEYYGVQSYELNLQSALLINVCMDYVATDLPYGRNTKNVDMYNLYQGFIQLLCKYLTKRAVVVFPHFFDSRDVFKDTNLRIVNEFSYYVHKSLSKKIIILEK